MHKTYVIKFALTFVREAELFAEKGTKNKRRKKKPPDNRTAHCFACTVTSQNGTRVTKVLKSNLAAHS